ncbi:hypothetical protein D043_1828B, partial [Vibrio parahaemolyticus EKP-021]
YSAHKVVLIRFLLEPSVRYRRISC